MEISLNGTVYKYTNFVYGYQERYFKLHNGIIYYYVSKEAEREGCRKFRALTNFKIELDDDPYRFDVVFPDERWSLRFRTRDELVLWRDALHAFTVNPPTQDDIRLLSTSSSVSTQSSSLFAAECEAENDKATTSDVQHVSIETLRRLRKEMPTQFGSVMGALDTVLDNQEQMWSIGEKYIDVNEALEQCRQLRDNLEYVKCALRAASTKMKVETTEVVTRKTESPIKNINSLASGVLSDEEADEWEDAVDEPDRKSNTENAPPVNGIKELKLKDESEAANKIASFTPKPSKSSEPKNRISNGVIPLAPSPRTPAVEDPKLSALFAEIHKVSQEQLKNALTGVQGGPWEEFVTDGEMRMYRMDHEEGGVACDPLKAVHSVKGVSAREYIDMFFAPDLKPEWDDTLVKLNVVEKITENTVILHQLHKRIWPSAQRESLFWSHRIDVTSHRDKDSIDAFMVCNNSVEREEVKLTDSSCVRVQLKIAMLCQTVIENKAISDKDDRNIENVKRDDVRCKITYVAQVHPGGWVPTVALRQVYKKEYPKFLRQFTKYVVNKAVDKLEDLLYYKIPHIRMTLYTHGPRPPILFDYSAKICSNPLISDHFLHLLWHIKDTIFDEECFLEFPLYETAVRQLLQLWNSKATKQWDPSPLLKCVSRLRIGAYAPLENYHRSMLVPHKERVFTAPVINFTIYATFERQLGAKYSLREFVQPTVICFEYFRSTTDSLLNDIDIRCDTDFRCGCALHPQEQRDRLDLVLEKAPRSLAPDGFAHPGLQLLTPLLLEEFLNCLLDHVYLGHFANEVLGKQFHVLIYNGYLNKRSAQGGGDEEIFMCYRIWSEDLTAIGVRENELRKWLENLEVSGRGGPLDEEMTGETYECGSYGELQRISRQGHKLCKGKR
ncbi:START domain-containing protein [Ditylenchus destructor]|uniref:START domain-containing protein n=1 Tax=Ditylenchus destructor TaxID=166010 RepID=A0AAD4MXT8_9BILA|nr:START domain-containing protein [Ditylenchus destructor]